MKSVALIACSNGLGHTRRVLLLANALVYKNFKVTIFAPLNNVNTLSQGDNNRKIKLVDFNSHTSAASWVSGDSQNWYKLLPDISEFDIVVCDNLIEILKIRHDAWLSGSFFWHEALIKFPEKLKKESQSLLLKFRPRMISSTIFSSEKLKNFTNLYEVGIYSDSKKNLSPSVNFSKNDVLIACGKSGSLEKKTEDFIKKISKEKHTIFNTVWVEPNLIPKNPPYWMKKATFTNKMYQSLIGSVIRPGVGTITDSLLAQSKVFLYYELDNLEMKENSNLLESQGLGVNSHKVEKAWSDVINYFNNPRLQEEFNHKSRILNISGAQEAADILASSLN